LGSDDVKGKKDKLMAAQLPGIAITKHEDGSVGGSFTVHPAALPAVNWAGLLTWIGTYGPNVMAAIASLVAVFGGPAPVTPPSPDPDPKP
jgi:hypothetical protein